MSYVKTQWVNGDTITAAKLNNIEGGIETHDEDISQLKSHLDAMSTATTADEGKALIAKTVEDGTVTEWEFGEAGGGGSPEIVCNASGAVASFADGADGYAVKGLVVNVEPIQSGSGDPSPDNIRPISGRTEVNVWRSGKNLFPTPSGARTAVDLKKGVSYVFSATATASVSCGGTYTDGTSIQTVWLSSTSGAKKYGVKTFDKDVAEIYFYLAGATLTDCQIEVGSTPTDYEPYTIKTIQIPLGQTVYGGTVDVTNGTVTVDTVYATLTGTVVTAMWSDPDRDSIGFYYNSPSQWTSQTGLPVPTETGGIFDYCKTGAVYNINNVWSARFLLTNDVFNRFEIRLPKSVLSSENVAGAKAYLNEHPLHTCYKIAPTTITLTPQTLTTLIGANNVWSDGGDVSVDYVADTKLYIEQLTEPDADMVADANITSGQYFMVGNGLYLATANIASGAAITPGVNCTRTSLAAALNAINA